MNFMNFMNPDEKFMIEQAIQAGLQSDSHPENQNIHTFFRNITASDINSFSEIEEKRGYKKLFIMPRDHAEPVLVLKKDGKMRFFGFTPELYLVAPCDIRPNLKKCLLHGLNCVIYAVSVLQNFDGTVLKKMDDGSLKEVSVFDVECGDEYITKQQLKLRQSGDLLMQFGIKSKYNPDVNAKNVVMVTDSKGRNVTLDEYNEKYMIEIEKNGKKMLQNKLLDMLTTNASKRRTTPRKDSFENIQELQECPNKTTEDHRLIENFYKKEEEMK